MFPWNDQVEHKLLQLEHHLHVSNITQHPEHLDYPYVKMKRKLLEKCSLGMIKWSISYYN